MVSAVAPPSLSSTRSRSPAPSETLSSFEPSPSSGGADRVVPPAPAARTGSAPSCRWWSTAGPAGPSQVDGHAGQRRALGVDHPAFESPGLRAVSVKRRRAEPEHQHEPDQRPHHRTRCPHDLPPATQDLHRRRAPVRDTAINFVTLRRTIGRRVFAVNTFRVGDRRDPRCPPARAPPCYDVQFRRSSVLRIFPDGVGGRCRRRPSAAASCTGPGAHGRRRTARRR